MTNVAAIAAIRELVWLHIGHSIVARAVTAGMERAVPELLALIHPRAAALVYRR